MTTISASRDGLQPSRTLDEKQRQEMFELLSAHFEGVTREQFELDLAEKNWVITLRREGRLLGFTTLLVAELVFEETVYTTLYSGDTIVASEARGSAELARQWIASVNHLRAEHPERPCYWLLLTSGFRTYRFLPVFWKRFAPHYATHASPRECRLMERLATLRYGLSFDSRAGIVRFPRPQRLRGTLANVPASRAENAHIAFFLQRNPGHARGDELVCLTEISEDNLTVAGRRMLG